MKTRILVPTICLLLSTTASWAAATPEEASRIAAGIQSYIGNEPGVVTVVPEGDAYIITIDANPYFKKSTTPGFTAKIDPAKITAKPNGDGTWAVSNTGPFAFSTNIPGTLSFDMNVAANDWSGTYSEALSTFSTSNYTATGITVSQNVTDPTSKVLSKVAYGIEKIEGTSQGTEAANGGVDMTSTMSFSGVTSATSVTVPPDAAGAMPNMNYTATMSGGSYNSKMNGAQIKPLADLLGWFVAHPSKELIVSNQAQLKEKLLAAIPAFASMESTGSFDNIAIGTALGQFEIKNGGSNIGLSGVVKDGHFAEGFNVTGLKVPPGILPPWSEGLVPTTVNIGFDLSGFDAEAPARMFVGQMDLNNPDLLPPGSEALYLPAFAPTNTIKISIPAGEISSDTYKFTYEGVVDASFAGLPTVNAKFSMMGMDAVIAKLQQAASDPSAQQGMAALFAVKGLGKAQADGSLTWDVTMGADGKMLVNGTDVSAMMGGAPAPAQ
jgi:hypothetical protein